MINEMTVEEARRILIDIADQMPSDVCADWIDAVCLGIKAIDAQLMRDATEEEHKSVKDYIESISKPTGVQFEAQLSKDCISRESLKQKLQEEHDFFVNAYGGNFKDMPYEEKVRVDEITNCIAMVVNEPSVTPERPKGKWIKCKSRFGVEYFECSECGRRLNWIDRDDNYCNDCGSDNSESTKEWFKERDTKLAKMSGGGEDEDGKSL